MEAEKSSIATRPIIRIEIQNDIVTSMDVDPADGEIEDGEVSEDENEPQVKNNNEIVTKTDLNVAATQNHKWLNKEGGFTTGVDIFSKDEQEKLTVRAQRFGINSDDSKAMTDQQLQELHDSLGITKVDEKVVRFDAVHIRGVEEMSTKDVFGYFSAYGPASIEWINDYSCNVAWSDNVSAARALHGLSKRIKGMEFLDEVNPFLGTKTVVEEKIEPKPAGRSILLINPTSPNLAEGDETESQNALTTLSEMVDEINVEENDFVNASDIAIPIPPGYWRFGQPHPKAKSILLRFALRTDRKPLRAEKLSDYYKKYGNPNFGGLRGIISESKKRRLRGTASPPRTVVEVPVEGENKNPWGGLAQNWSNEDKGIVSLEPKEIVVAPPVVRDHKLSVPGKSILERIGNKRKYSASSDGNSDPGTEVVKRKKMPRMRMYADEEQARLNRLKELKKATQANKIEPLHRTVVDISTDLHGGPIRFRTGDGERFIDGKPDLRSRLEQTEKKRDWGSRLGRKQVASDEELPPYSAKPTNRFESRLGTKPVPTLTESYSRPAAREATSIKERIHRHDPEYYSGEEEDLDDDETCHQSRQRSTVKVVVRNRPKPTVASTVTRSKAIPIRLSDRDNFRSGTSEVKVVAGAVAAVPISERKEKPLAAAAVKDLRAKIPDRSAAKLSQHTTEHRSTLIKTIKREDASSSGSSGSSSGSDSDDSSSSSSSEDSDTEKTSEDDDKHNSPLKKALSLRENFLKGEKISLKKKDSLRIEVRNDNYKKK